MKKKIDPSNTPTSEVREGELLSEKHQKKGKGRPDTDRAAMLKVSGNRWCIAFFLVLLFAVYQSVVANKAKDEAVNNTKVEWVKLYPNGSWDVELIEAQGESGEVDYFKSTVDSILLSWVERRYSKIPSTIKSDYGFSQYFMSPAMRVDFLSSGGFNAPQIAADIMEGTKSLEAKAYGVPDHYDSDKTVFGTVPGQLYRSNIYIKEQVKASDGSLLGKSVKKIISLQWRIKTKQEIVGTEEARKEWNLIKKINPVGLEIIKAQKLRDLSEVQDEN